VGDWNGKQGARMRGSGLWPGWMMEKEIRNPERSSVRMERMKDMMTKR
jgi:hypothetical protein